MAELESERRTLEKDLTRWNTQLASHAARSAEDDATLTLIADLQERVRDGEQRLTRVKEQAYALRRQRLNADEVAVPSTE